MADERTLATADASTAPRKSAAKTVLIGTVLGAVFVGGLCGMFAVIAGAGTAAAVGVGAFTALFGGPGFGGMVAFTVYEARNNPHEF